MQIGIDLGGTKIELVALQSGQIRFQKRIATPASDYDAIVEALASLVDEAERTLGTTASVGIGTPGALSPATGLLRNSNMLCLNGRALHRDLEARMRRPVRLENDANCFALSEAVDGAGAWSDVVFGVILGTGVGGGVVVRKQIVTGPNAIGGEWGHNPLPAPRDDERPGALCYCGRHGCIETFLSGPSLAREHAAISGGELRADEIATLAAGGDSTAAASMQRYCDQLARSLGTIINVLDPHTIVLGGGLSKIAILYDEVPKLWSRYVFSDRVNTQLRAPVHGDASGVRGAAWLWPQT